MANTSAIKRGFRYDVANSNLDLYVDGTKAATAQSSEPTLTVANGLTVTAGGVNITAGGFRQILTVTDYDAQSPTLAHGAIAGGIITHNSKTGAGNATTDTATSIISSCNLTADNQCAVCYYVNRGDQTVTLVGGTDVTIFDSGQTIAADESAILLFRRTSATAVTVYHFGA